MTTINAVEAGDGKAFIIFTAPADGNVRLYAEFSCSVVQKTTSASLEAFLNGIAFSSVSDSDFNTCNLIFDKTIPITANTTLTFLTHRRNSNAATTAWKMFMTFS